MEAKVKYQIIEGAKLIITRTAKDAFTAKLDGGISLSHPLDEYILNVGDAMTLGLPLTLVDAKQLERD